MTLKEVSQLLAKDEKTIYYNFHRTQQTLKKKGIILTKWGRGKNVEYEIEYEELEE